MGFAGTGSDPEDGTLTGASLVWTSSINGQIGTGTSFSTTTLSAGTHTITLTAKVHKSDTDLLKERAMRLQKQLNEVEEKIEELNAPEVSAASAETAATS